MYKAIMLGAAFALSAHGFGAAAEERNAQAVATMRQYAQDMNDVLPCAYVAMTTTGSTTPDTDPVDRTYGYAAIEEAIGRFLGEDGSPAERSALIKVFADNFTAKWSVDDIRKFTKHCAAGKIIEDIYMLRGRALPLFLRPPFNSQRK